MAGAFPALIPEADIESARSLYDSYETGRFVNLQRNRARWIEPGPAWAGPDLFEYIPKIRGPFQFVAPGGRAVVPRNMITDVGTIPRIAGLFFRGLSPWGYAPAYLIHDWEFELHHCGRTTKTFDQVRDTMMQAVKTLMEEGLAPKSTRDFWLLFRGIDSDVARRYWNRDPPRCTLPPDRPE